MATLIFFCIGTIITLASLVITFFFDEKKPWSKWLFVLGIVGVTISCIQFAFEKKDSSNIENDLTYADIAKLNYLGLPPLVAGNGMTISSPLSSLLQPLIVNTSPLRVDCSKPNVTDVLNQAVAMNPKFPFSYYYRALCERLLMLPWKSDIASAKRILLITTTIPDHNPNHDEILKAINDGDFYP